MYKNINHMMIFQYCGVCDEVVDVKSAAKRKMLTQEIIRTRQAWSRGSLLTSAFEAYYKMKPSTT